MEIRESMVRMEIRERERDWFERERAADLSCTDLTQELAGNLSRLCSRSRLFLTLALLLKET